MFKTIGVLKFHSDLFYFDYLQSEATFKTAK